MIYKFETNGDFIQNPYIPSEWIKKSAIYKVSKGNRGEVFVYFTGYSAGRSFGERIVAEEEFIRDLLTALI